MGVAVTGAILHFMNGAIAMGCAVAALFFWRFYRQTRDRLFVWFALAFCVFMGERIGLLYVGPDETARAAVYLARAVGFALIIGAIIDKNRARGSRDT